MTGQKIELSPDLKKSASAVRLDVVREANLTKKRGETFGCELVDVGKRVFVTLVRRVEVHVGDGKTLTPAYRAGLRFGDELIGVNGVDANSIDLHDLYKSVTDSTEVKISFRTSSMQIDYRILLQPGMALGLQINDGQIVNVRPGSAADIADVPKESALIAINERSLVGLKDSQIASVVAQEAKIVGNRPAEFTITVMPWKLYSRLLPSFLKAIEDFGLPCSPSFLIENDSEIPINGFHTVLSSGKLAPDAFTCQTRRKTRGASVSSYFTIGDSDDEF